MRNAFDQLRFLRNVLLDEMPNRIEARHVYDAVSASTSNSKIKEL